MLRDESLNRRQTLPWLHCCHLTLGPEDLDKAPESTKPCLFGRGSNSYHIPAIAHITSSSSHPATCTVQGCLQEKGIITKPKGSGAQIIVSSVFRCVGQSLCRLIPFLHFTFSLLLMMCNTSSGETYTRSWIREGFLNIIPIWPGACRPKFDDKLHWAQALICRSHVCSGWCLSCQYKFWGEEHNLCLSPHPWHICIKRALPH